MSSPQERPLDLSALADRYDIVGEYAALGHNRRYPGRRREDGRDVLITVLRATSDVAAGTGARERTAATGQPDGLGRSKAIAQFAADANLMTTLNHPNVPRVLEGRWVGEDAFALVTDRVHGVTLAEMLRGDRLEKPQIADILADVDGVLEWARNERLSHRGVTPDSVWIERGTNRVFVTLAPMETPKTNRPDPRDDARTIGQLALAALTAKPMTAEHDDTLLSKRPDLPERVAVATEKLAACTTNDDMPDVSAYLASLAMADAIKEGEVEVARLESEHRAQMKAEREKWEAEQEQCRLDNETQAQKFAEERAEYERRSAREREQLAAARAEVDKRREEVQLARKELAAARAAFKERKAALEARTKQVDKQVAELEKQKRALERRAAELEQRNLELQQFAALAASGAAEDIAQRPTMEVPALNEDSLAQSEPIDDPVDVASADPDVESVVEDDEEVKGWTPIETEEPWAVPLESDEPVREIQYEAAAVPAKEPSRRPGWVVPAGIVGAILLLGGAAYAVRSGRDESRVPMVTASSRPGQVVSSGLATPVLRTDSAAGNVEAASDSAVFAAIRDSITAADEARRIRRERAAAAAAAEAEAERQRQAASRTVTDSTGTMWLLDKPPGFGTNQTISADSLARLKADTIARRGRDSVTPVAVPALPPLRIDTTKPRPDTIKPKPDTVKCCRN